MRALFHIVLIICTLIGWSELNAPALAGVQEFLNDRDGWEAAVGSFDTITFTEYPANTVITDQYRDKYGVQFVGFSHIDDSVGYINDGFGLRSPQGVRLIFDEPKQWIGADFPGWLGFHLLANGGIFHTAQTPTAGTGNFFGMVSATPFDEVIIFRPGSGDIEITFIDDLHFGPAIPAPGALGLLAIGALIRPRQRRA